ncbi:MAG: hypothetical protein HYS80_00165, partial [Candidatus Aenigmarchaeota archaeon]|nr:hypothetical protein [Candidatus Aenigmarchaeota archaeon]
IEDADGNNIPDIFSAWWIPAPEFGVKINRGLTYDPKTLNILRTEWVPNPHPGGFLSLTRDEYNAPENIKVALATDFLINNPNYPEISREIEQGLITTSSQLSEILKSSQRSLIDRIGSNAYTQAATFAGRLEINKGEILTSLLSPNPEQAIEVAEQVLRTSDRHIIDLALREAGEDLYVVDLETDLARPLWEYLSDVSAERGELNVRVGVEPLAAYLLTAYLNNVVPWAIDQPAALLLTRDIALMPGNRYVTVRLRPDERGDLKLSGGFETGENVRRLNNAVNSYVMDKQPELDRFEEKIRSGTGIRSMLQTWGEIGLDTIEQLRRRLKE